MECGFDYVLLGCIQSDSLESRFGWFRQLSGANYFISWKQLVDSDRKIRSISLLKHSEFSVSDIDNMLAQRSAITSGVSAVAEDIFSELQFSSILSDTDFVIIRYVCGACARSLINCKKCEFCKEYLVENEPSHVQSDFIREISRGGLLFPSEFTTTLDALCWLIFVEIQRTPHLRKSFLQCTSQRELFCSIVGIACSERFDTFFRRTHCPKGHDLIFEISQHIYNCMAKNLAKSLSTDTTTAQKRKVCKLSCVSS